MTTPLEHVKYLSENIGPRGSTTVEERESAKYIAEQMEKVGAEVSIESFKSYTSFSYPYGSIYLLSVIGGFISLTANYILSFILSLIAVVIFGFETHSYELISKLFPRHLSQNVLGKLKASEQRKRLLIVSAHYDSSRSAISFSPTMVKSFRSSFLLMSLSLALIPVLSALGVIVKGRVWSYLALIPSLYLLFAVILMIHRELFGKYTPGANDNASGVGVLLSLAETLGKQPLENTETWFLATGCEEVGMVGMLSFLREHKDEMKEAYLLNLDNVGIGDIKYITAEGMLKSYPSHQELVSIAQKIASSHPEIGAGPKIYDTLTTDALPALVRGYKAMSIMSFDKEGVIPNWHWRTDVYANVEEETLNKVDKYLLEIVREMDKQVGELDS